MPLMPSPGRPKTVSTPQDRVRFIQVRHEEAAAFMACAYAKYTGRLGCCLDTSGPGGIHLLNGLERDQYGLPIPHVFQLPRKRPKPYCPCDREILAVLAIAAGLLIHLRR